MKSIEFNKEQLEAYKDGATKFLVPLVHMDSFNKVEPNNEKLLESYKHRFRYGERHFISDYAPLQKGDEFFIKASTLCESCENFQIDEDIEDWYDCNFINSDFFYMNLHDERLKDCKHFKAKLKDVVLDVEIKMIEDLSKKLEMLPMIGICYTGNIIMEFEEWLKSQGIRYEDTYVFIYTVKGVKCEIR